MRTVYRWLEDNAAFRQRYARAREMQADAFAEQIIDLADQAVAGKVDANAARVAVDARKWVASKLKPKVYGDRSQVDLGGGLEVASRNLADGAPDWIKERLGKNTTGEVGAGIAAGTSKAS